MVQQKTRQDIHEWVPDICNIGCFRPEMAPEIDQLWQNYLKIVSIKDIGQQFFNGSCKEGVGLFDLAALTCFWYQDKSISGARHVWLTKPRHHSLYIFDKGKERLQIRMRQADLDGEHWKSSHLHVCVGERDPQCSSNIIRPTVKNEHVPLIDVPSRFCSLMYSFPKGLHFVQTK